MNNYKFRGKRIDNGEWVYGLLIRVPKRYTAIDYCTIGKKLETELYIQVLTIENNCELLNQYKVIPESVGQYIGENDINNKEIYTGCIVKYKIVSKWECEEENKDIKNFVEGKGKVEFIKGQFLPRTWYDYCDDGYYSRRYYDLEIIDEQ
jgi:hypothetical protein